MSSEEKRPRKKLTAVMILLLLLLVLLLVFKCGRTGLSSANSGLALPVSFRDVAFVELIYEQSFHPFDEARPVPPQTWSRRAGYIFEEHSAGLFTNDGRADAPAGAALVGRRLWFHHQLWPHSFDQTSQLHAAPGGPHVWDVAAEPAISQIAEFDGFCHVRAPLKASVEFDGEVAKIVVGDESRRLAPGESAVFKTSAVEFEVNDLVAAMNRRLELPEDGKRITPEMLLEHAGMLGLKAGGSKITLHARLRAVSHKGARIAGRDLAVLWREGEDALNTGDFETAMKRFQTLSNVLPEDQTVAGMLAMATHPPPQLTGQFTVSGSIEYPAQPPDQPDFPPYIQATALDPGAAVSGPEVAYITQPKSFALRLKPGRYRLALHMPGHAVVAAEIDVRGNSTHNFKLEARP